MANLVSNRCQLIKGRWGFIDGKNRRVQKPTAADVQNAFYNGWLHATLVTGTACYSADGVCVWAKLNCPGSWNDGDMSREFQEKIGDSRFCADGFGILADSAFPVSGMCTGKIMTPLKDGDIERAHPRARRALQVRSDAITFLRQSAEWSMGCVDKCYRILDKPLPYSANIRQRRLEILYRLYNYRVRTTKISQVRNYFLESSM
jgi:hypothetical protein